MSTAGAAGLYSNLPDQAVSEYTDEVYMNSLRFLASRWNFQSNNYFAAGTYAAGGANGAGVAPSYEAINGFAYNYIRNSAYVFGSQTTSEYGFFVKDDLGQTTRIPMYRGRDVTKYFNYIDGKIRELLEPLPKMINVAAYSEGAASMKKTMMNMINYRYEMQEHVKRIEAMTGMGFEPVEGIDYENDFEVKKKLETFQEAMEIAYERIAKDTTIRNKYMNILPRGAQDIFISGVGMIKVYEEHGRIRWKKIDLRQCIFDNAHEDPLHDNDDYGGEMFEMTIDEVLARWKWSPEEQEDLKGMASNTSSWATYNTFIGINGLYWWQVNNGVPKVACVEGQWRSLKKEGDGWVETLREGILIGNKYLRDQKETPGQVYDKLNPHRRLLKYRVCSPNIRMGAIEGIVGMIKRLEDLKDAFITKAISLTASAIGKSYYIRASKLPEGLKAPDIISQLKQCNILVIEDADMDETDDDAQKRMIEGIDMTLDPNVNYLIEIARYFDQSIADILNIPDQVRGQQGDYQSKDVYSSNLAQSEYGMKWYYGNIMMWIEGILSYSADLAKALFPETQEGRDQLSMIVGDAAVEMLSMETIKSMRFEDFLLRLIPNDIVSEREKADYMQLALQLASSGQFSMLDYIKLRTMDNKRDVVNYFEYTELKKQQQAQEAQMMQMQQTQQATDRQAESQEYIADKQAQTKLEDRQMQNEQKLTEKLIDAQQPQTT